MYLWPKGYTYFYYTEIWKKVQKFRDLPMKTVGEGHRPSRNLK